MRDRLQRIVRHYGERPEFVVLGGLVPESGANFQDPAAQGSRAYVTQMRVDHPELDPDTLAADAVIAVGEFVRASLGPT